MVVVMLFLIMSCGGSKIQQTDAVTDRAAMPQLRAYDITTVISDSGITRYRISTPEWNRYDRAVKPYWEFPRGIYLERFDEDLNIDANVRSKYAKYLENEQLWELRGDVRIISVKGEMFESERFFWNERTEKIYSDTLVRITQPTRILNAIDFWANQQMTKYQFSDVTGPLLFEE